MGIFSRNISQMNVQASKVPIVYLSGGTYKSLSGPRVSGDAGHVSSP
jgi:hypothetical protein